MSSTTIERWQQQRFSLYVYQHPTDEQKQVISELYGYKEDHTDQYGYTYTHDSAVDQDDSSSDSYSESSGTKKPTTTRQRSISKTSPSSSSTSLSQQQQPTSPKTPSSPLASTITITKDGTSSPTSTTTASTATITPTKFTPPLESSSSTLQTPKVARADSFNSAAIPSSYAHTIILPQPPPPSQGNYTDAKVTVLNPPDRAQLPPSYFSTVKSAYADQNSNYKPPAGGYLADEYDEKTSLLQPVNTTLSTAKDWNAEFQTLVNNNKIEGYRELSKLAHDFVYTAKIYGKVIISELTLPLHLKTIKPINIGGVAGGHKYIALGILFKLALDSQGLYCGDQNAMKAAGHELKGLMSYYNCRVDGLHHPLMALIDYRGYRLVAMSLLPINSDTIVYGSSDGGITVHCENEQFNEKMKDAARILNLKGHMVGKDQQKLLHSCGDIEGHIGADSNFYLLDFARVFPPQMKLVENSPPSHLYELIRPELVKSNPKPLSSDSLTGWGKFDSKSSEHNYEVKEATFRLFLYVIPKFAHYLDHLDYTDKKELHLTQELHRVGINCRHMGLVRRQIKCKSLRRVILDEIVARTMKCEMMALFRSKMKTADTPSEEPFKEVVVAYLNRILKYEDSICGKIFPNSLKKSIQKKFIGTFQIANSSNNPITFEQIQSKKFDEEGVKRYIRGNTYLEEEEFLVEMVDIQNVMKRFNQLTGVGLTPRALREITKQEDGVRLVQSDVKRMKAKVKAHHLVEFAEGMVLWDEAKKEKSREKIEGPFCPCPMELNSEANADRITDRLMGLADEHFARALAVSPHSGEVSANWALMLVERARMSRECVPTDADIYYNAAEEKLRASVCDGGKPKITLDNVLLEYAEFLCIWGTHNSHLELDMQDTNGLKNNVFNRASKKIIEAIKINPFKITVFIQKSKIIEKAFHESTSFKQMSAYYAGVSTICNCVTQSYEHLPPSSYREIAAAITQNLSPYEIFLQETKNNPTYESPDFLINHIKLEADFQPKNYISKHKDQKEIAYLLENDPLAIIKVEMGCLYIRYGYISHLYGIQCSKRNHTKMASIKLLKKSGTLFQKGIDLDPINRDIIVDHVKKFTSSSQFVEFYQSAIGCPSILDFIEDRLLRIAHMSLKDCSHLPIEFVEGIIEYSPRVKMLVLDGCRQITDSTIELIVKKLPHLETLSLAGCTNITTIIPQSMIREYMQERAIPAHHDRNSLAEPISKTCSLSELKEKFEKSSFHSTICLTKNNNNNNSPSSPVQLPLMSSLNNILASTSLSNSTISLKPLTFLQNLNLNGCKGITDEKLIMIANMHLPLVNVYFKKCNVGDQSIIQLAQNCSKLSIIELSGTQITDAAINAISINCLSLRELHINDCPQVTTGSIDKLFRLLHDIRLISLADCPLAANDNTLRLIGKYCPEIQFITLTRNQYITDVGFMNMVKHCNNILELNIEQCTNLTDASINQLANYCHKLRVLRMPGLNNVTSLKAIGNNCPDLVFLDISECHKISTDLGYITKGCTKLHSFRLRRCYGLVQDASLLSEDGEIHQMPRLTLLDWSHGNIEFQAIHSISHSCKSLTSLNISYCKSLTDNAIERIASSLTSLTKLKIDGIANITDEGIKSLSEGPIFSTIEVLSLVGCRKISDVSAYHILRFHNLKKISIGGCLMTTNGADLIASESFELVKIHVRHCLNINPTVLQEKHPHISIDTTQKDNMYFAE
eukprot:gene7447-9152_t